MLDNAEIERHRTAVLAGINLPVLSRCHRGKVRDNFDFADGTRIMVTTDRLSVFDQVIGCIPFKGQVLNQIVLYWFQQTVDIIANPVLAAIDPNVVVVERLDMIPVEVVVRAYMTGSSETSLWTLYKAGYHAPYGLRLPTGLRENYPLPQLVLTPTTKARAGRHDEPISATDVVARGLLTAKQWERVSDAALRLFARGSEIARRRGLILVDTKYEFGLAPDGRLMIADEIHTPDSSRYWRADSYNARLAEGKAPENLDKDFARLWVVAHCDPYRQRIPELPSEMVIDFANSYVKLYEIMTGAIFVPPPLNPPPLVRVRTSIERYRGTAPAVSA